MQENKTRREFISDTVKGAAGLGLTAASWNKVLGANDRIRLGVIGTGNRGKDVMSVFQRESDVEVVGLSDCYSAHLELASKMTDNKAKTYTDYRALLEEKEIDAVLTATPDHWHKRMAIDVLKSGKDLYIEKPLTFNIDEGHEIINTVKSTGKVLQVGLQQRSGKHYKEAKEAFFDTGKIGKVTMVRTWWYGNSYHLRVPKFKEQPAGLDWKSFLGSAKYRPFDAHQFYNWRAYLDFGGGQITDLFTHWIDVVHWYMKDDIPISATAIGGVYNYKDGRTAPDTISISLEYPTEWTATFDATLVPGARGEGIEFYGTEGRLYIDRAGYTFQEQTPRKQVASEPVVVKNTYNLDQLHVRNFLDCMKSRQTPNSDVVGGHRSALASHLGKIAYIEKRRVTFNPNSEKTYVLG